MTLKPQASTIIEKVAAYVRVSHEEQKLFGISLDAQRERLLEYAKENNLQIVEWYEDEGISGRKLIKKRPELQRMLNDAQTGKFTRIIFVKLDRYFRSVAEYYECQKILEAHNVTWTATTEKFDLTTANGRYWVTQKLAMAEYEADQTSERIKMVNEYKIKNGQPLTGAQSLGIAYTVEKIDGVKKVVKNKENEEAVTEIIQHYLVHQNKIQTRDYVNAKLGTNITFRSITTLLKDTKLYGFYKGNPNYCEPYITKETFDKLQEIVANNIRTPKSSRVYLFTGLIPCPVCGKTMKASYNGQQINRKKSGKVYIYHHEYYAYRCSGNSLYHSCTYNGRPNEATIEKHLIETLDVRLRNYIEASKIEDAKIQKTHASDAIMEIKSEMKRLNNMYRKERISESEYDAEFEALERQLAEYEKYLEPVKERDLSGYEELLQSDWKAYYYKLTKENKRAFWRKVVKSIKINEQREVTNVIFF